MSQHIFSSHSRLYQRIMLILCGLALSLVVIILAAYLRWIPLPRGTFVQIGSRTFVGEVSCMGGPPAFSVPTTPLCPTSRQTWHLVMEDFPAHSPNSLMQITTLFSLPLQPPQQPQLE